MGLLVDGEWRDQWYDTKATGGRFKRDISRFRNWVTADGRAGPSGASGFQAEAGRYHLYVSYACPWAHRTLIARKLKRLENAISISAVDPFMGADGWWFSGAPGAIPDTVNGAQYLRDIYLKADPNYTGRVTVGGAVFERRLKIETVMPNRLKIALDFGRDLLKASQSRFLHRQVGLDVSVSGCHALMAQPERDHAEGHAGLQHMHGRRVPHRVR